TKRPAAALPDFAMGVDLGRIALIVGSRVGMNRGIPQDKLFRFRTDTFVEQPEESRDRPPLQLTRGIPPAPTLSGQVLREAALAGGRYLAAHLAPNGRYICEQDLNTGCKTNPACGAYSRPRHAGTTYFLAELYRITKEEWLREPLER